MIFLHKINAKHTMFYPKYASQAHGVACPLLTFAKPSGNFTRCFWKSSSPSTVPVQRRTPAELGHHSWDWTIYQKFKSEEIFRVVASPASDVACSEERLSLFEVNKNNHNNQRTITKNRHRTKKHGDPSNQCFFNFREQNTIEKYCTTAWSSIHLECVPIPIILKTFPAYFYSIWDFELLLNWDITLLSFSSNCHGNLWQAKKLNFCQWAWFSSCVIPLGQGQNNFLLLYTLRQMLVGALVEPAVISFP